MLSQQVPTYFKATSRKASLQLLKSAELSPSLSQSDRQDVRFYRYRKHLRSSEGSQAIWDTSYRGSLMHHPLKSYLSEFLQNNPSASLCILGSFFHFRSYVDVVSLAPFHHINYRFINRYAKSSLSLRSLLQFRHDILTNMGLKAPVLRNYLNEPVLGHHASIPATSTSYEGNSREKFCGSLDSEHMDRTKIIYILRAETIPPLFPNYCSFEAGAKA